jgi:hypothetical protein
VVRRQAVHQTSARLYKCALFASHRRPFIT